MRVGRWLGAIGAVLYAIGFVMVSSVPGGGDPSAEDFEDFYVTDDSTAVPLIGLFLLSLGAIALAWFLHDLRRLLPAPPAAHALVLTSIGLAVVAAGASVLTGPSGAQAFSDLDFVGRPVAHALAQSGFAAMLLPGSLFLGAGVAAFGYAGRVAGLFPGWLAVLAYVAGVLQLVALIWIPSFAIPLWLLVASVVVAQRREVAPRAETTPV